MTEGMKTAVQAVEGKQDRICQAADQIWEYAELSLQEFQSARMYCRMLEEEGFQVEKGICGIETAFSARFGSGRPVIGILAEYDALSGLSQEAGSLEQKERTPGACGHGCGHNLLGAGAFGAAMGVKAYLEQTNEQCVPVILIDRYYENSPLPYVVTNNFRGGYMAASLLVRNGHKNIACVQGPAAATTSRKRIEGCISALTENGLEDRARIVGDEFSVQNGYLETKLLLNDSRRPTAIFALSNNIGMGVIKAVREAGLRIPDDISLIFFDNYPYLDFLEPPVTRIGQMVDEMGKMAVKLLNESIVNHRKIKSRIDLSPEMIMRESVAPLNRLGASSENKTH